MKQLRLAQKLLHVADVRERRAAVDSAVAGNAVDQMWRQIDELNTLQEQSEAACLGPEPVSVSGASFILLGMTRRATARTREEDTTELGVREAIHAEKRASHKERSARKKAADKTVDLVRDRYRQQASKAEQREIDDFSSYVHASREPTT